MVTTLAGRFISLLKKRLPPMWGVEVSEGGVSGKLYLIIEVNRYEARVVSFEWDELRDMDKKGLGVFAARAADRILEDRARFVKLRRGTNER